MKTENFAPFVVLRAIDQARGERMNVGVILFSPSGVLVAAAADARRIKSVHPDFASIDLAKWAGRLQDLLNGYAKKLPDIQQLAAMLPLLCQPFHADADDLGTTKLDADPADTLKALMAWQVDPRSVNVRPRRVASKKSTRLASQMRAWFRAAKVFSTNSEDLSKGRVVANFPVDARDDLYTDFALKNGRLHVIETLDLRGVDHLTPSIRGEAAIKGFTLSEAENHVDGDRIAVVSAPDVELARPAIRMIQRSASRLFVLESPNDKQEFVDFLHQALHNSDLPDFELRLPLAS